MRLRIVTAIILGTVVGGAVLFERFATADTPDIFGEPQVPGRIVSYIIADTADGGSAMVFCEYDAQTNSRDSRVEEVVKEGTRKVPVGGELVNWVQIQSDTGIETNAAGEDLRFVHVYWDESGNLRAGCAPESVVVKDDGTETTVGDQASLASPGP